MTGKALASKIQRNRLAAWVRKSPVSSFILLAFGFTYLVGGAYNGWVAQFSPGLPGVAALYLPRLLIVTGPAFAAIMVTYLLRGRIGVRRLLQSLYPQKRHLGWYLLLPILGSAITFASFLIGGLQMSRLPEILADGGVLLLSHLVIQVLIIGIGEELGWRGWLLPQLSGRYPLAKAMFLIFIIWGAWHFPVFFMGAAVVVPWVLVLLSATIILTWVWLQAKGDMLVLAVAHASINFGQFFLENQFGRQESELLLESWKINGFLYVALAVVLLFRMRRHLSGKVVSQSE